MKALIVLLILATSFGFSYGQEKQASKSEVKEGARVKDAAITGSKDGGGQSSRASGSNVTVRKLSVKNEKSVVSDVERKVTAVNAGFKPDGGQGSGGSGSGSGGKPTMQSFVPHSEKPNLIDPGSGSGGSGTGSGGQKGPK